MPEQGSHARPCKGHTHSHTHTHALWQDPSAERSTWNYQCSEQGGAENTAPTRRPHKQLHTVSQPTDMQLQNVPLNREKQTREWQCSSVKVTCTGASRADLCPGWGLWGGTIKTRVLQYNWTWKYKVLWTPYRRKTENYLTRKTATNTLRQIHTGTANRDKSHAGLVQSTCLEKSMYKIVLCKHGEVNVRKPRWKGSEVQAATASPHSTKDDTRGLQTAWQHSTKNSDGWAQTPQGASIISVYTYIYIYIFSFWYF